MMYGQGYGYSGGYGNMMGGYGGWIFGLFGLLILVVIVLLVVWAVRSISGSAHHHAPLPTADDACTIAKARYAKGKITKEQYEEICKTLGV
jgi:uncharacterized membrane protein